MTPSARIQASIEIIDRLSEGRMPLDTIVGDYMRGRRYIGSKDRAAVADRVYEIVRHKARLEWWLTKNKMDVTVRNFVLASVCLLDERKFKEVSKVFDGSNYGAEKLSDDEIAFVNKVNGNHVDHPDMPDHVALECPENKIDQLKKRFGKDFKKELQAMMTSAPLDIRTNIGMISRENAQASLAKDEVEVTITPYSPWGMRLTKKTFLSKTKAFSKGFIDIQDEGSQMIALAVNAKPGMQVIDYCAGGGGKTLAIACSMNKKGRIVAMDLDERRLNKSKPRFKRAYIHDSIEIRPLSDVKNRKWIRRQKGTFDRVILDVPCSGSGTWRRNPDMRWFTYGPTMEDLLPIQAEIMDKVAHTLKVGGRLIYATCSLFEEENENQVEAFLARNSDYKLMPLAEAWPDDLKAPCEGDYMRLSPYKHNTDGFFSAVLERVTYTEKESGQGESKKEDNPEIKSEEESESKPAEKVEDVA